MGYGAAEMWTSPALPFLQKRNSEITVDQGSIIASLYNLGAIIGYLLYPFLIDRIGRKFTLLLLALPQIISWAMVLVAKNLIVLYLARLLCGISYGASFVVEIIYAGEIAEKDIRGFLVFFGKMSYNIGSLIVVTAGAFLSYHTMNFILLSIPLIFFISFVFMPESPYFYLKCDQEEEAIKSLSKLRGTNDLSFLYLEINRMKDAIIDAERSKNDTWINLLLNKRYRKASIITLTLKLSVVFSGYSAISAYAQDICSYSDFSLAPEYAVIILESGSLFFIISSAPLVDWLGRRFLILYSGLVCTSISSIIGLFFFCKFYLHLANLSLFSWVPLVSLIIFKSAYMAGLVTVSSVVASEIFPVEVKNSALSLIQVIKEILSFLNKLGFKRSISTFGIYSVFWIDSFFCFILPLIGFFILPETKGSTLEEIQLLLS